MSQLSLIRAALEKGDTLTPIDALNRFGCFRLGARIHDLREEGYDIATLDHHTPSGSIVAEYKLVTCPAVSA